MKLVSWKCEICGKIYDSVYDANACESAHNPPLVVGEVPQPTCPFAARKPYTGFGRTITGCGCSENFHETKKGNAMNLIDVQVGQSFEDGNDLYMRIADEWDNAPEKQDIKCLCLTNGETVRFGSTREDMSDLGEVKPVILEAKVLKGVEPLPPIGCALK